MTITLDTNLLVYASNEAAPEHPRARALLEHVARGPGIVVLLWPALLGYLRLVTHPSIFDDPLDPDEAMANVDALLLLPHIRVGGELDAFWSAYRSVATEVPPRGNLVPDAHLVALMRQHGVTTIWSRDRDLRRFDNINVLDPFHPRYENGFDLPKRRR